MMNLPLRSGARILSLMTLPSVLTALGLFFCSPDLRAETELIPNDKFADDGASWTLSLAKEVAARMSVEKADNEPALCIDVEGSGEGSEASPDNIVNARVHRLFGEISAGTQYRISFKAKAEKDISIVSFVSPQKDGARVLWRMDVKLDPEWKEFAYNFTARDTANDCVFGFSRLGNIANKYWFKDVVLTAD